MAISTSFATSKSVQSDNPSRCSYCGQLLDSDDFLLCGECKKSVHIKCLKNVSTPGALSGDVFFDFTCANCVQEHLDDFASSSIATASPVREKFVRQHLPWLMIITLTLYNLSVKAKGLSNHGYFHWRTHIVNFIDNHWDNLFPPNTRRRKNWIGSISGNISHNSPEFFVSGHEKFNEPGWWKLTHSHLTPRSIYNMHIEVSQLRQKSRHTKRSRQEIISTTDFPEYIVESKRMCRILAEDSCSRTLPYMGCKPRPKKPITKSSDKSSEKLQEPLETLNTIQSDLKDFLAENLECNSNDLFETLPTDHTIEDDSKDDLLSLMETSSFNNDNLLELVNTKVESSHEINCTDDVLDGFQQQLCEKERISLQSDESIDTDEEHQPRIVQVINYQDTGKVDRFGDEPTTNVTENGIKVENSDETPIYNDVILPPKKQSLFTKPLRRPWPWLKKEEVEDNRDANHQNEASLVLMSEYEERKLLKELRTVFSMEEDSTIEIPAYIRRFYRKLCIREWKRKRGKSLFNIFNYLKSGDIFTNRQDKTKDTNIIDRYQLLTQSMQTNPTFYARIVGSTEYELFESPYTQRILQPFIYRNSVCFPPRLKLLCEMQYAVLGITPTRAPIDFCYVRPNHIPAVNGLLQSEFWPGIDMSECLSYPDFSVVALYKKLVIGCGFLVPDVRFNEAYISFMAVRPGWHRSGIGTFMLYHLIQTCMSKDITLHVSATNPAVVLYQKFGFKIEEVIVDFYDKYLPIDSPHSPNALFLRLRR